MLCIQGVTHGKERAAHMICFSINAPCYRILTYVNRCNSPLLSLAKRACQVLLRKFAECPPCTSEPDLIRFPQPYSCGVLARLLSRCFHANTLWDKPLSLSFILAQF